MFDMDNMIYVFGYNHKFMFEINKYGLIGAGMMRQEHSYNVALMGGAEIAANRPLPLLMEYRFYTDANEAGLIKEIGRAGTTTGVPPAQSKWPACAGNAGGCRTVGGGQPQWRDLFQHRKFCAVGLAA